MKFFLCLAACLIAVQAYIEPYGLGGGSYGQGGYNSLRGIGGYGGYGGYNSLRGIGGLGGYNSLRGIGGLGGYNNALGGYNNALGGYGSVGAVRYNAPLISHSIRSFPAPIRSIGYGGPIHSRPIGGIRSIGYGHGMIGSGFPISSGYGGLSGFGHAAPALYGKKH